jgi:hypothetical protein
MDKQEFGFGVEAEFLIANKDDFTPLTPKELSVERLLALIESIPTSDIPTEGMSRKPLHSKISPYLLEGYYLTDKNMTPISLLPKGIEIRTPISHSISETISMLQTLFVRLRDALSAEGYVPVILSHHPRQENFNEPPNYDRHDYWQWALIAATTYGPDVNISLPEELSGKLDRQRLSYKCNYYGPSIAALSMASPFYTGELWRIRDTVGKSIRTYRRSLWATLINQYRQPKWRFEFKGFEMAVSLDDYHAFFLTSLALLLDDTLIGEASPQTRVYDLGSIAVTGLGSPITRDRASLVLQSAEMIAERFGFERRGLDEMWNRIDRQRVPADDLIEIFEREKSIERTLSHLTNFTLPKDAGLLSAASLV